MRWFYSILLLCCVSVTLGNAQSKVTDKGKYVSAIVDPNNQGLITLRRAPGTNFDPILSYPQKSFLSIMVGDKIFTNNHTGSNISGDPRFGGFLDNGITQKVVDTLRTIWASKNGCDIIQEVYPVTFEASAQIVMRWKIKNATTKAIWGQGQYLLDLQVGAQNPNDGAPILTPNGYRPTWAKHTGVDVPWFFAAFENQLPNPPSFGTGVASIGYNQDVNYKLGLKKPTQLTVGDWGSPLGTAALVDFLWGVSPAAPWGSDYTDAAIHFQWEGLSIAPGKTLEVASTSYGTSEFGICTGQIFGVVFYPRYIRWKAGKYTPDTANIEFYGYNVYSPIPQDPNFGPPSENTTVKLHVGPSLRIIAPDTNINFFKTIQEQKVGPNGRITQYGMGTAKWKVRAEETGKMPFLSSWLKFTAKSSFSGTGPIFFNSGDGDTCEHPIKIEIAVTDSLPPSISTIDSTRIRKTFKAFEMRTSDRGIKSVSFRRAAGTPTSFKFDTLVTPVVTDPCTLDSVEVRVTQKDSTIGGCVEVLIADCADNISMVTLCFPVRELPDIIAPVILLDSTTRPFLRVSIRDSVKYDLGIDSVWFVPWAQTDTAKFSIGKANSDGDCPKSLYYEVAQLDTLVGGCFTVFALDCAGNLSTSKLYCFPVAEGSVEESGAGLIDLIGNPASERTTLRIDVTSAYAATIRVVDLTGREVTIQQAALLVGRNDIIISTSMLSEGTYYVIAEWDGRSYARKLSVIK